jgi:hypothetical protein
VVEGGRHEGVAPVSKPKAPLEMLLGVPGDIPVCRVFAPDVSVHWWETGAVPGDPCLCGAQTMDEPSVDDDPAYG